MQKRESTLSELQESFDEYRAIVARNEGELKRAKKEASKARSAFASKGRFRSTPTGRHGCRRSTTSGSDPSRGGVGSLTEEQEVELERIRDAAAVASAAPRRELQSALRQAGEEGRECRGRRDDAERSAGELRARKGEHGVLVIVLNAKLESR